MIKIRLAAIICVLALAACRGEAGSIYLGSANDAPELPSTISDDMAPSPDGAAIRFVDVGPGLCVVGRLPGGHDFLYDAGHWVGSNCLAAVRELVTDGLIELVVISHSDADHIGELDDILAEFDAGMILHTGYERDTTSWQNAEAAIQAQEARGATIINLADTPLVPGEVFGLGQAQAVFIAGWPEWDESYSDPGFIPEAAERRNVISIVMRIEFAGRRLLLTGDTIGRRLDDVPGACRDAQAVMVGRHPAISLDADILLSAHHGGDNGDAACFIEAVSPQDVIISAGHAHRHPRLSTIERYLAAGIDVDRIYRMDRGDDEGAGEWDTGRIPGCSDSRGDDTLDISIPADPNQTISIAYVDPVPAC
ncbi:ComEC/Rec2 family competence protein [Hyphobacterium sp.]|uniref:ComEC/Rec2 family competence protein n=1 Tax=Hyphobacterium sp. TaxID=2004662 RepID=UPI00374971AE